MRNPFRLRCWHRRSFWPGKFFVEAVAEGDAHLGRGWRTDIEVCMYGAWTGAGVMTRLSEAVGKRGGVGSVLTLDGNICGDFDFCRKLFLLIRKRCILENHNVGTALPYKAFTSAATQ